MDCPHLVCQDVFHQAEEEHFVATQAKSLENICTLYRNIMCVNKQSLFYSLAVRINEGLIAKDIRLAGH